MSAHDRQIAGQAVELADALRATFHDIRGFRAAVRTHGALVILRRERAGDDGAFTATVTEIADLGMAKYSTAQNVLRRLERASVIQITDAPSGSPFGNSYTLRYPEMNARTLRARLSATESEPDGMDRSAGVGAHSRANETTDAVVHRPETMTA